jgi:hypothetical protein
MSSDFLKKLKDKKDKLESQIKLQQAKLNAQAKKDDTRRKILVGAYFLEKITKEGSMPGLQKELDKFLFRPNDRALFELAPRAVAKEPVHE